MTKAEQRSKELDRNWQRKYEKLITFQKAYGHCRVPSTWHEGPLARWVSKQRENEKVMAPSRKRKLNDIGFSWHHDMLQFDEDKWEEKFTQLKEFYRLHSHFRVPSTEKAYHSLRIWMDLQRKKEKILPVHRHKKLDAIGFAWSVNVKANLMKEWNAFYEQLVAYYRKYGNSNVSSHSREYGPLGKWVSRQRRRWDALDGRRQKKLRSLKFVTSREIQKEKRQKWLTMLAQLKRFKKMNGHCLVPDKYKVNPALGGWVAIQRLERDNMPSWRKEKLNELGFTWRVDVRGEQEKKWYHMYDKLEKFFLRFGHSQVPEYWKEDEKLAIWVAYQRRPKMALSRDKIDLLKKLNFLWNPMEERKRTRNKEGHFASELVVKK